MVWRAAGAAVGVLLLVGCGGRGDETSISVASARAQDCFRSQGFLVRVPKIAGVPSKNTLAAIKDDDAIYALFYADAQQAREARRRSIAGAEAAERAFEQKIRKLGTKPDQTFTLSARAAVLATGNLVYWLIPPKQPAHMRAIRLCLGIK